MLSGLASIAEIVAGFGVVFSLLFVGWEIRRNTNHAKLTNWTEAVDRGNALLAQPCEPQLAAFLARGREDYDALSPAEQIMFGSYHNQLCLFYETMIVLGRNQAQGEGLDHIPAKQLAYCFSFPGARQWWTFFSAELGLHPSMESAVNAAIAARPAQASAA